MREGEPADELHGAEVRLDGAHHRLGEPLERRVEVPTVERPELRIRRCLELGEDARVIATGGLAPLIGKQTESIEHIDSDLTLSGLYLIHRRNVA